MLVLVNCGGPGVKTPAPSPTGETSSTVASDACHVGDTTYCVLNPSVTPETIQSTICVAGWTATIRPSASYTSQLKLQQMQVEGLLGMASDYEEDHRLPLELGGAPSDPMNLSPEARIGAPNNSYTKDQAENLANQGADLRQVQADFALKWLAPWPRYT